MAVLALSVPVVDMIMKPVGRPAGRRADPARVDDAVTVRMFPLGQVSTGTGAVPVVWPTAPGPADDVGRSVPGRPRPTGSERAAPSCPDPRVDRRAPVAPRRGDADVPARRAGSAAPAPPAACLPAACLPAALPGRRSARPGITTLTRRER